MYNSPLVVLYNTDSLQVPIKAGANVVTNQSGFIGVGVDSGGVARFIQVDSSGNLSVNLNNVNGLALDATVASMSAKLGTGSLASASSTSIVLANDVSYLPVRNYEAATFMCIASSISIGNNVSLISLMNTGTKKVRIVEIYIARVQTNLVQGIGGVFQIHKITGSSSGTSVGITSMDSIDTLDSGISVLSGATIAGSSGLLRRVIFNTNNYSANQGSYIAGLDIYEPIVKKIGDDIKPITIRNGEGITLNFESNSANGIYDIHLLFTQE